MAKKRQQPDSQDAQPQSATHEVSQDGMRPAERKMMEWLGMTRQSREAAIQDATDAELSRMDTTDSPAEMIRICADIAARRDELAKEAAAKQKAEAAG